MNYNLEKLRMMVDYAKPQSSGTYNKNLKVYSDYFIGSDLKLHRNRKGDAAKHFLAKVKNWVIGKGFKTNRDRLYPRMLKKMKVAQLSPKHAYWEPHFNYGKLMRMQLMDGRKFTGSYRDGMPNGIGSFKYESGRVYKGMIVDGKREGIGTVLSSDRVDFVAGEFKNDELVKLIATNLPQEK